MDLRTREFVFAGNLEEVERKIGLNLYVKKDFFSGSNGKGQFRNWLGFDPMKSESWGMQQGLATILQVVIGSSVGAGVVTFLLNFWKAERDTRRANLERLYTVVQKYVKTVQKLTSKLAEEYDIGEDPDKLRERLFGQDAALMELLIDLYFPQQKPNLSSLQEKCFVVLARLARKENLTTEEFKEIFHEACEFQKAVASLAHR